MSHKEALRAAWKTLAIVIVSLYFGYSLSNWNNNIEYELLGLGAGWWTVIFGIVALSWPIKDYLEALRPGSVWGVRFEHQEEAK